MSEGKRVQKVLISVDTEGPAGSNPIDALIYGKTSNGKEYGIRYLMKIFDKYKAKGLFFVDLAEAWHYGEKKIIKVLETIVANGHDVGVHLHPDHMIDRKRRYLWEYSYDEQYEMIVKCTDLYRRVLKKEPLSFRAGRYGANNNTIRILDKLGYKYDMSVFYGSRYCKIDPHHSCNRVVRISGSNLLEIPVTVFKSFNSPFYSRMDKIDCGLDINEFRRAMEDVLIKEAVDVTSFFVHSFSVLNWRRNPDNPKLNKKLNLRLEAQLEWISNCSKAEFISEADLALLRTSKDAEDTIVDISKGIVPYWFFVKRALGVLRDRMILNV